MSLISQAPLTYGTFYGTNPGLYLSGTSNTNYSAPINLSYANRQTSFCQKSGNNVNTTKNGKYQIFLKFRVNTSWNSSGAGLRFFRISLNKNSSPLKELNYYRSSGTWVSQINQFEEELLWPINDDGTYLNTTTGAFFSDNGFGTFTVRSVFSMNDYYEFISGDVLSMDYAIQTGSSVLNLWVTNLEIIINEVKY